VRRLRLSAVPLVSLIILSPFECVLGHCRDTFGRNDMSQDTSSEVYPIVLAALRQCDGKCLDTEAERAEVAMTVANDLAHPDGFFAVTHLHRSDLIQLGFDPSGVDDGTMQLIAEHLSAAFVRNDYWLELEWCAERHGIKRQQS